MPLAGNAPATEKIITTTAKKVLPEGSLPRPQSTGLPKIEEDISIEEILLLQRIGAELE